MSVSKKVKGKKTSDYLSFEHKNHPLLPIDEFYKRQLHFFFIACILIAISLLFGMLGYRFIAGFGWIESYQNAAMILAGMGEINDVPDGWPQIFSGSYALFSGVIFLSTVAVMFSPMVHRLLHKMHVEGDEK